jgi:transposase-like protein
MKKQKEENPIKTLAEELFGGVKDKKEFNNILAELFKHGIETVLKAELDEHVGHEYPRHRGSNTGYLQN